MLDGLQRPAGKAERANRSIAVSGSNTSNPTGNSQDRRKLIAVVYADMVGYSRLIGLDDAGTLERLRTLRRNLLDPAIEEHAGHIVQTGGDSLLVVFDSIDGAVRCGVQVQHAHHRNRENGHATHEPAFNAGNLIGFGSSRAYRDGPILLTPKQRLPLFG